MATIKKVYDPNGDLTFVFPAPPNSDPKRGGQDEKKEGESNTEAEQESNEEDVVTTTLCVSSKHLSLSSRVFRTMLSRTFQEGNTLHQQGKLEITLDEDDLDAFETIINIIHNRKEIPKRLETWQLANIAVLVDKYEFHDAVRFFMDFWIEGCFRYTKGLFNKATTRVLGDKHLRTIADIGNWLCIAWVMDREADFKVVTRKMVRESMVLGSPSDVETDKWPIPQSILDAIKEQNKDAIEKMLSTLAKITTRYQGPGIYCLYGKHECDGMMLGCLIRGAFVEGLWPIPDPSNITEPLSKLSGRIKAIKCQSHCKVGEEKTTEREIEVMLDEIYASIPGLDLHQYKGGMTEKS